MKILSVGRCARLAAYYFFARHLPPSTHIFFRRGPRGMRRRLCSRLFKTAGTNINIESGAYFWDGSQLEIGDNSSLGVNAWIDCGPVKIGRNVMMGPEVIILTSNHRFDRLDVPMIDQGNSSPEPVVIGDDVWIGTRVVILPGVTVGRGSILGAGAIVTRDVPEYAIAAGNPAKVIRYRTERQ